MKTWSPGWRFGSNRVAERWPTSSIVVSAAASASYSCRDDLWPADMWREGSMKDCSFDRLHYMPACSSYGLILRRDMGETKNDSGKRLYCGEMELQESQKGKTVWSDRLTRCCEGCLRSKVRHTL